MALHPSEPDLSTGTRDQEEAFFEFLERDFNQVYADSQLEMERVQTCKMIGLISIGKDSDDEGSSSQTEEYEFSGGSWAAMKAEMSLDERNPSCFLHSYSVDMVLRRAAQKQLPRNKVPNMAVLLKNIVYTNTDAKAVFKDPTGEIQGTVHRRLVEERAEELKVGAVLLLKQVGVFSSSHHNHYLNVTPNNLLRLYAPVLHSAPSSRPGADDVIARSRSGARHPRGPVSVMQLDFDKEDDNVCVADNLDELLGELPEDSYSL